MIGWTCKQPDKDPGNKPGIQNDTPGDILIKVKYSGEQEKEGNCIIDHVTEIGMNKRTGDNANEAAKPAGKNSKIIKIKAISNLVYKYKPDEKQQDGGRYQAQNEPFVFNVGFFRQFSDE
jgi:hypothetical protein